jgi:lysophospholipase L1-like esterase
VTLRACFIVFASVLAVALIPGVIWAEPALHDGDRIVFIGDSITGQGGRSPQGWVHLIAEAMHEARPASHLSLVALGGSGMTVGAWQHTEQTSREIERELDLPGIKVKATLDGGADVLIVMLGMNDVISPAVTDRPVDVAVWADRYRALLAALRERLHPRVIGLATVTLATEDSRFPKNRLGNQLNEALATLAREQGCLLLPTRQAMEEVLHTGRTWRPDFHVTGDYVHANLAGHVAIAMGMLRGLSEEVAAAKLQSKYEPKLWGGTGKPTLSYAVQAEPGTPPDPEQQGFLIRYWWHDAAGRSANPPKVRLLAPPEWTVAEARNGSFRATGAPSHIRNVLTLEPEGGTSTQVTIPAPWILTTGVPNPTAWPGNQFDAAKGVLPLDSSIAGGDLTPAAPTPLQWRRLFACVDQVGGADPSSVDLWAASIGRIYEAGYGVRWVYSAHDRPIQLVLSSHVFAGNIGLTTWLNARQYYAGLITSEPGKKVALPAMLKSGWNCLAFKCNHLQWEWQIAIAITGTGQDDLADVRSSTVPHRAAAASTTTNPAP